MKRTWDRLRNAWRRWRARRNHQAAYLDTAGTLRWAIGLTPGAEVQIPAPLPLPRARLASGVRLRLAR